jgi:Protein of unknown function (DUF2934)
MKEAPSIPEAVISPIIHDIIARCAYDMWERDGNGHGSHERHWKEAERWFFETKDLKQVLHFRPGSAEHTASHPD